jgi:hypothetical protein
MVVTNNANGGVTMSEETKGWVMGVVIAVCATLLMWGLLMW